MSTTTPLHVLHLCYYDKHSKKLLKTISMEPEDIPNDLPAMDAIIRAKKPFDLQGRVVGVDIRDGKAIVLHTNSSLWDVYDVCGKAALILVVSLSTEPVWEKETKQVAVLGGRFETENFTIENLPFSEVAFAQYVEKKDKFQGKGQVLGSDTVLYSLFT